MKINKTTNIIDYLKKKNVKRFSLFIVIAFVFLIFSKFSNDYKQTIKLKLNLVNLEDEIILEKDSLNVIDAYIEAKGFALLPFLFRDSKPIILEVNTDLVTKPEYFIFDIQKNKFIIEEQLGESYKVLSVKPDTLLIHYSKSASKFVPIALNSNINYAVGYDIKGNFNLDIDSVKVVGSSKDVDAIKTINTQILKLNGLNSNINEEVKLDLSNYKNLEVYPKVVNVSGEIARFTEGTIEVPIKVINKPSKIVINYFPKTITLSYYVDLENYNTIKVSDFVIECDFSEVEENQTYFIPKIVKKPEFIKRIGMKQKRIDFIKL